MQVLVVFVGAIVDVTFEGAEVGVVEVALTDVDSGPMVDVALEGAEVGKDEVELAEVDRGATVDVPFEGAVVGAGEVVLADVDNGAMVDVTLEGPVIDTDATVFEGEVAPVVGAGALEGDERAGKVAFMDEGVEVGEVRTGERDAPAVVVVVVDCAGFALSDVLLYLPHDTDVKGDALPRGVF